MKTTPTKTPPQWKFEDSRAGMRESMSTPTSRRFRSFYVIAHNPRAGTICRPFSHSFNRAEALADAQKAGEGSQVVSATEYRELTGRSAASDYAREMAV